MRPGLLRQIFFWTHLVSGIAASLVIGLMSLTGVALTFEAQMLDTASASERRLEAVPDAHARLSLEALVEAAQKEHPELKPSSVAVFPEADAAVLVSAGRRGGVWVHPVTGESWKANDTAWHKSMSWLRGLHRWLALEGEGRSVGRAITGASNLAFLLLAVTGLVLWFPRRWTKGVMRSIAWFRGGLKGKARDFNWHNVIGLWTWVVMVVIIASGVVISYGWASDLVYRIAGEAPPVRGQRGAEPEVKVPSPAPGATRLPMAALLDAVKDQGDWERLTIAIPRPAGGGEGQRRGQGGGSAQEGSRPPQRGGEGRRGGQGDKGERPVEITLRSAGKTPVNANIQLAVDPYTGAVLKTTLPTDASAGRRLRTWLRFLHTGEALGIIGQIVAGLTSLGGVLLVWTGLALSWRRFFRRKRSVAAKPVPLSESAAEAIPELSEASLQR